MLSKQSLLAPYRIQADLSLEQQSGGAAILIGGGRGKKDYLAVELNTIGMGISVYVTATVDGDRRVLGGGCMTGTAKTPPTVRGAGEVLYDTMQLGLPLTLFVDVEPQRVVVSSVMGEICRVDAPADALREGRYGVARIPYTARRRAGDPDMSIHNVIVTELR